MAIQTINLGTYANDGKGDDLRTAFQKVNANLIELYSTVYGANVGSTPPTSGVEEGELWWSTVEGRLYVYYSGAWIDASPEDGFIVYNISAIATSGGANIRLEGNDASIDEVKIASSTNITVTRTDANTITLSSDSYTGDLTGTVTGLLIGNVTGNVTGEHFGPVIGDVLGDVTGNVTGNLTGDVTGNLTGAASLNVLKTGDTLTGDINWSTTGRGLTWGMNSDGASIKFYNVSDFDTDSRLEFQTTDNGNEYFSWTYATNGGSEVVESMRLTPNSLNNAALRIFGSIAVDGDVLGNVTGNLLGDVTGDVLGNVTGDVTGNLTGDVTGNLTGNVTGDVTGNLTGNVTGNLTGNVTGDVTGNLTGDVTGNLTGDVTGNLTGDVTGNADTVTNGVYTTSSITALADVDTSTVIPTIGQGLIWSGANWIPGTVSTTENNTFEFGGFIKTFIDPVSYLLDAVGVDFGTFTVPASYTIDLGTF